MTGVEDGAKTVDRALSVPTHGTLIGALEIGRTRRPEARGEKMTENVNANELRDHLREWMRKPAEELTAHLREMGIEGTLSRQRTALIKLHADHHGTAPLTGSAAVGATVKPEPVKAPAAKPAPAKPATKATPPARKAPAKAPAAKAPAKPAPARKAPAKTAPAKPATKTTAKAPAKTATKSTANGSAPAANASKHDLAKRLIDMVAAEFADETPENKAKLAYWLHGLPTGYPNGGGGGYLRYWPKGLPRPTTAGWRAPSE